METTYTVRRFQVILSSNPSGRGLNLERHNRQKKPSSISSFCDCWGGINSPQLCWRTFTAASWSVLRDWVHSPEEHQCSGRQRRSWLYGFFFSFLNYFYLEKEKKQRTKQSFIYSIGLVLMIIMCRIFRTNLHQLTQTVSTDFWMKPTFYQFVVLIIDSSY